MNTHIVQQIENANKSQKKWRITSLEKRVEVIKKIAKILEDKKDTFAKAMTEDMHKPLSQSIAEIEKCVYLCNYYTSIIHHALQPQKISSPWQESEVRIEPLGVILGVMPWNYPFWQVMRFAIPTLLIGNTVVVKHASNVPKSAQLLEDLFQEASEHTNIYQNISVAGKEVTEIIASPIIKAVSLTGSEAAGKAVASEAGKYLKKCVLELGGSNATIVCNDVNIPSIIKYLVMARMQNTGQSCIAAKRFLVHQSKIEEFVDLFKKEIEQLIIGDPMDTKTVISQLAREDLAEELETQLQKSIEMGAQVEVGGKRLGAFFAPTLVSNVQTDMPIFKEETFGPLAVVMPFETIEEAIELSNLSDFGLGVSLYTSNPPAYKKYIPMFDEGAVFINEKVTSDPNLPFGGIKKSGYGRELSTEALKEFANLKTVVIAAKKEEE